MRHSGVWNEVVDTTGGLNLERQVHVFRIHEVFFAEATNANEDVARYQHARAGDPVDNLGIVPSRVECSGSPQASPWPPVAQRLAVQQLIEHGGKCLNATG